MRAVGKFARSNLRDATCARQVTVAKVVRDHQWYVTISVAILEAVRFETNLD